MAVELLKRNKDLVPSFEACGAFRMTASPFRYFSRDVMEQVLGQEHYLRCLDGKDARGDLEDKFGVFWK